MSSAANAATMQADHANPAVRTLAIPGATPFPQRWFADETYVKVAGKWRYVYRAIDQFGQVIDVFVAPRRDVAAARRFFERASLRP